MRSSPRLDSAPSQLSPQLPAEAPQTFPIFRWPPISLLQIFRPLQARPSTWETHPRESLPEILTLMGKSTWRSPTPPTTPFPSYLEVAMELLPRKLRSLSALAPTGWSPETLTRTENKIWQSSTPAATPFRFCSGMATEPSRCIPRPALE